MEKENKAFEIDNLRNSVKMFYNDNVRSNCIVNWLKTVKGAKAEDFIVELSQKADGCKTKAKRKYE